MLIVTTIGSVDTVQIAEYQLEQQIEILVATRHSVPNAIFKQAGYEKFSLM